jgi:hypothetical protein
VEQPVLCSLICADRLSEALLCEQKRSRQGELGSIRWPTAGLRVLHGANAMLRGSAARGYALGTARMEADQPDCPAWTESHRSGCPADEFFGYVPGTWSVRRQSDDEEAERWQDAGRHLPSDHPGCPLATGRVTGSTQCALPGRHRSRVCSVLTGNEPDQITGQTDRQRTLCPR